MDLGGVISNLLSLGVELLTAVITSAQAPSTSSASPAVDENQKIEAELKKLISMLEWITAMVYDAKQREKRDLSVQLWLKELERVAYNANDVLNEYHHVLIRTRDSRKRKLIQVPYGMLDQIQQIRSRFDKIVNDGIVLQLSEGDGPEHFNDKLQMVIGRETEKEKLIHLLSIERDVISVVAIAGLGGIGKTTLAQLAYTDERIQQKFDIFGWIYVSNDFNVERLTKKLVESITGNECGLTQLSALHEKIWEAICGKRVLLVLDDVCNVNKSFWNSFKSPFMSSTFVKILVTTRNDHVMQIMQTEQTIHLGSLPPKQCWRLFKHYAFGGVEHNKDQMFVEIGLKIVNKCGMLPLAVKSIASLLRHEAEEESWRDILESELWQCDVSNGIPAPHISYARLPTYIKSCFSYCSMFPKEETWREILESETLDIYISIS